jgi:hypothetical protein
VRYSIAVVPFFLSAFSFFFKLRKFSSFGALYCSNTAFCFTQCLFLLMPVRCVVHWPKTSFLQRDFHFVQLTWLFLLWTLLLYFPILHWRIHQNRYRLKAKLNTGKCEVHQYPHKKGMSLPLLQVSGGNPTFLKVKRSGWLQTSEIWVSYHADWSRHRIEGREIWKKSLKMVEKFMCENTWVNKVGIL